MFDAACEFSSLLRARGHRGISVNHCSFDRLALSSLSRCLRQRVEAQYVPELSGDEDPEAALMCLLDWHVATSCPLHDASYALSWSTRPFSNEQLLSDLFIVVSSIRNVKRTKLQRGKCLQVHRICEIALGGQTLLEGQLERTHAKQS